MSSSSSSSSSKKRSWECTSSKTLMSSSSSKKRSKVKELARWKHDVFLSFRGKDTRFAFTDHLYQALVRQGINTYRDDKKLRVGKFIRPELLQAIEVSKFAIVVLSSGYAESTWCLDELAKIVERMEQKKLIVVPFFYHVDPSDVRHQRNTFEQAFAKHEKDHEIIPEKVKTWRDALTQVGNLAGSHIKEDEYESESIGKIVREISQGLQDTNPINLSRLVGIESRVKELNRLLCKNSNDVRFIGIYGMSGIGKTTLAEVVCEDIRNQFDGYSILENIKDVSEKSDLCKLQRKLLIDLLKDENIRVGSVSKGASMLQKSLHGLKILLVLDDVNRKDQLESLAWKCDWFGHGSRIIITTTNEDLLIEHGVDRRYKCEGLIFDDARRLFCMSAFKEGQPKDGYEMLCDEIVKLSDGLPLALAVFGSLLVDKEVEYWRNTLKKLQQFPQKNIVKRLEICYERLDRNEQEIFIYIACFLKGRDERLVKDILKNIGLEPETGIEMLIKRSLITVDYDDSLWMHDLVQQMGWEILRKKYPEEPGKRTGLESRQDIVDIFTSEVKGSSAIEIINQQSYGVDVAKCDGDSKSFKKMTKLKFLRINNFHFPNGLKSLSNDLLILEWHGCSLKSVPSTFEPKQLYELDMRSCQIEKLWEKHIGMPNLRSICLSHSASLTKIPDLTSTPSLVKLNLEGCKNLVEVHQSVFVHKKLSYVNLESCISLKSLGCNSIEMEALKTIILSGCSELEMIPKFWKNMKCLEHLYLDGTKIKTLPENLGEMHSLRKLDVSEAAIQELPSSILNLEGLRLLRFHGCRHLFSERKFLPMNLEMVSSGFRLRELDCSDCNLSEVPYRIGRLFGLVELDLSGNPFCKLPPSIRLLSNIRMFRLNSCKSLVSLPELPRRYENHGTMVRFTYYISEGELDISKFDALGDKIDYTVSCLNCPKLVENGSGSGLADTILNKYLQVRDEFEVMPVMPVAIFEIVAAGSEIPQWFHHQGDGNLINIKLPPGWYDQTSACMILKSIWENNHQCGENTDTFDQDTWVKRQLTWMGLALCVVYVVNEDLEVKYEIVAQIRVAGNIWEIPVPTNFLKTELENQLVWYWTFPNDLQRAIDRSQQSQFYISFAVKPEDGNLEVMKSGARFVRVQDFPEFGHRKFIPSEVPESSVSLYKGSKTIGIRACEEVEWVVPVPSSSSEYFFHLSSLEKLSFEKNVNMKGIFNWWESGVISSPPIPGQECFSSLKKLDIKRCDKMKVGLTVNCLLHLPILEELSLRNCRKMEEIIRGGDEEEEGEEDNHSSSSSNKDILLSKLKKLDLGAIIGGGDEEEEGEEDNHSSSSSNIDITLPKLRTLSLQDLPELKSIYNKGKMICDSIQEIQLFKCPKLKRNPLTNSGSDGQECFFSLKKLRIWDCPKMKVGLTVNCLLHLSILEELCIRKCRKMEEIIGGGDEEGKEDNDSSSSSNIDIALPKLRTLSLQDLPELKSIYNKGKMICDSIQEIRLYNCPKLKRNPLTNSGSDGQECFFSLKKLTIEGCNKMKVGLTVNCLLHLPILEDLFIKNCEEMEEIIGGGDEEEGEEDNDSSSSSNIDIALPKLRKLVVYNLPKLKSIYNKGKMICDSIQEIQLFKCPKLKRNPLTNSGSDGQECFFSLKKLRIWDCPKMKVGLTVNCLLHLSILEELCIRKCRKMEEIIGGDEEEEREEDNHSSSSSNKDILLPKLEILDVWNLGELKSIYNKGKMICDSIQEITLIGCPKLKKIPLASSRSDGQVSPFPALERIFLRKKEKEWWESVEWVVDKTLLQRFASFR